MHINCIITVHMYCSARDESHLNRVLNLHFVDQIGVTATKRESEKESESQSIWM